MMKDPEEEVKQEPPKEVETFKDDCVSVIPV